MYYRLIFCDQTFSLSKFTSNIFITSGVFLRSGQSRFDVLCVLLYYSVERSGAVDRATDSPLRGSGFESYAAVSNRGKA